MSTMIRSAAPVRVRPGQLLGARQLADEVRRLAARPSWSGQGEPARHRMTPGANGRAPT